MFKQSRGSITFAVVLFALLGITGCTTQKKESNILIFDSLQKEAVRIGSGLYVASEKYYLTTISSVGYADVLGNYLIYYRRERPDDLIIRTKENIDIDIDAMRYKWGLSAVFSFDQFIVANVPEKMNYTGSYVLISLDQDVVSSIKDIDYTALMEVGGGLWENFITDRFYGGILSDRRLRGNTLFYLSDERSYIFQVRQEKVLKIAESDALLSLRVPELVGYREAIIKNNQLFIHDFGTGANLLLGVPIIDHVLPFLFSYSVNKVKYLFDPKSLVSYPAPNGIDYADGYDGGYYFVEQDKDPRFEKTDWSFYYSSDGGNTVNEILRLKDSQMIENVICQNGKLYISAWHLGFVYDIAQGKILESYVPENQNPADSYKWVVYVQPFGGKTYVHLREPVNYPGHD